MGKTTVALNLALQWAKEGLKVLLIDADPLSDIAAALDIGEEELVKVRRDIDLNHTLDDYKLPLFSGISLLFPHPAAEKGRNSKLRNYLQNRGLEEAKKQSDMLIMDLPAGIDDEENISFLPFAQGLLLVSNPDPLSHAAAGAYLKKMEEEKIDIPVLLWHNRYKGVEDPAFNPQDIIGNYNRNVPPERRLDPLHLRCEDIAQLPPDPALDLLAGEARLKPLLLRSMVFSTELLLDTYLQNRYPLDFLGAKSRKLLYSFLRRAPGITGKGELVQSAKELTLSFLEYLALCTASRGQDLPELSEEEEQPFLNLFSHLGQDKFYLQCRQSGMVLEEASEELLRKAAEFTRTGQNRGSSTGLDKAVVSVLMRTESERPSIPELRNPGGLLFFQYGLLKLFESPSVRKLVDDAVPRTDEGKRDRRTQIALLIRKSDSYHGKYLSLVKRLFPLTIKQINTMADTLELQGLLLRGRDGKVSSTAYASLTSSFLHEAVNSGLGIIIGFKHRPAAGALQTGAKRLLERMQDPSFSGGA